MAVDDATTLAEWRIGGRLDPSAHRPDDWLYADLEVSAKLVGPDVIDPTNSADIVSREWSVTIGGAPDTDGDGVDEPDGTATEAGRVWWTDNLKPTYSTGDAGLAFAPQTTSWLIKVQVADKNGRLVSLTERSLTIDGARDYEAEGETFTRPGVVERDGVTPSQIIDVRHLVPPVESVPPTDLFADAVDAAVADGHAVAVDPHGDRAYADGVAATVAADAVTYADGVGTAAVDAAGAYTDAAFDEVRAVKIGVVADGSTNTTTAADAAVTASIAAARPLVFRSGRHIVDRLILNDPALAEPVAGDYQREFVRSTRGAPGRRSPTIFSPSGSTPSSSFLVRGRNGAGVSVESLTVDCLGACRGVDLTWQGDGSAAAPGVAPQSFNRLTDLWVENYLDIGLDLSGWAYDTPVSGVVVRDGNGSDPIALRCHQPGGQWAIADSAFMGGRSELEAQNAEVTNVVFTHGVELTGVALNEIRFSATQFLRCETWALKSSGAGNATRAIVIDASHFLSVEAGFTGYIQGRFWVGGRLTGCHFKEGALTANIVSAAGSGRLPVFTFRECVFEAEPDAPTDCIHVYEHCLFPGGIRKSYATAPVTGPRYDYILNASGAGAGAVLPTTSVPRGAIAWVQNATGEKDEWWRYQRLSGGTFSWTEI